MPPLLAQTVPPMSLEMIFSAFSVGMTAYFWVIRSRQERPNLKVFQIRDFRATVRRGDAERKTKRLAITQVENGGVLVANHSIRQNSIVRFDCFLDYDGVWLKGDWGYLNDDKPPWNVGPQTAIAISPACFFDVPEDFEPPEDLQFRLEFITACGKRFRHTFSRKAPNA